jgi:hypothetical protein
MLMHQMRISTNQVSSVVLKPKKLEIRKIVKTVKEPKKQILCHEIEPNPSKDIELRMREIVLLVTQNLIG